MTTDADLADWNAATRASIDAYAADMAHEAGRCATCGGPKSEARRRECSTCGAERRAAGA